MTTKINKKDLFSYVFLAMPIAFAGIPLYIHAPDFYATEFGVSLASLGIILLVLRLIDAVQDPIIGIISDKYSNKRPLIMALSAIVLAISFALLFKPLGGSYVIWFAVFIFLATTAFSILTINLNAIGGLWSKDKNQKTTIASVREALGLIGLILAVTLPSLFSQNMEKQQAFLYVSVILSVMVALAILVYLGWQNKHQDINKVKAVKKVKSSDLKKISNNTKKFLSVYAISMLASAIPAVLVIFFIRDRLNLESFTGLFLLAYFLSAALGIVVWKALSVKYGKYKSWLMAMILAVVSFVWAYFLKEGDMLQYAVICILSGVAFGAELVLPTSILADHIHDNKKESQASLHYGALAFLAKASFAIAAALSLPFLDTMGFTPDNENGPRALHALSFVYAAIPCAIKLVAIYLLWRLTNEKTINNNVNSRSNNYA